MSSSKTAHYYARYLEHPSGVTDSLNNWAQASIFAGDKVTIYAAQPRGGDRNEFAMAPFTRTTWHIGRSRATWIPIGLLWDLRKGDLLVLHEGWVASNVFAFLAGKVRGAKVVIMPHGVYEKEVVNGQRDFIGVRRALERFMLRKADAVHVFYDGERRVIEEFAPGVRNFIVAPNGASAVPASDQWRGDGDYFLWMGRFDVFHKGLDNLVGFWAQLPTPRPKLLLVGPDFMNGKDAIRTMVADLDLEQSIEIRGRVSGREKAALLAGTRAYLHPSRWESCSIMLLEATAAGVPSLISSSIHAAGELEPKGVLRSISFATAGASAAIGLGDVDRNSALGKRAKEWAESLGSWNQVGTEMISAQSSLGLRHTEATRA